MGDLGEQGIPTIPIEVMEQDLNNKLNVPSYPASALKGMGVDDTLRKCLSLTLQYLRKEEK